MKPQAQTELIFDSFHSLVHYIHIPRRIGKEKKSNVFQTSMNSVLDYKISAQMRSIYLSYRFFGVNREFEVTKMTDQAEIL